MGLQLARKLWCPNVSGTEVLQLRSAQICVPDLWAMWDLQTPSWVRGRYEHHTREDFSTAVLWCEPVMLHLGLMYSAECSLLSAAGILSQDC